MKKTLMILALLLTSLSVMGIEGVTKPAGDKNSFSMPTVTWVICDLVRGGVGLGNSRGDASVLFKIKGCTGDDMPGVYENKWVKLSPAQSVLGINILSIALDKNLKVKLGVLNLSKMNEFLSVDGFYVDQSKSTVTSSTVDSTNTNSSLPSCSALILKEHTSLSICTADTNKCNSGASYSGKNRTSDCANTCCKPK